MMRDKPKGFYIDYDHPETVPASVPTYSHVEALFAERRDIISRVIGSFASALPDLRKHIEGGSLPWENPGQFPHLDFAAAYCLVRGMKPAQVVEIGSGTSTHVVAAALADNGSGRLKCIDPAPRRDIESLGVDFERRLLSVEDVALAESLQPNDVLFIDSSHIFFPGCDVDIEFNRLFPALPSGAFVHVHDIFLPDGYPADWHRRHYAEQNALIGWIMSGYFDVHYPGYYAATRMQDDLARMFGDLMPENPARSAGSIWLRKR